MTQQLTRPKAGRVICSCLRCGVLKAEKITLTIRER